MLAERPAPTKSGTNNALLVLPLTEKDGELTESVFRSAGIRCVVVANTAEFCARISEGVGVALVSEEAIEWDEDSSIKAALAGQPTWSDLPLIVLTRGGADSPLANRAFEDYGNALLLERPVRINTLISAARGALRARHRQYQIRDYLLEREAQTLKLARSNKDLEDFAYISSHDLQEPLRKVASFVSLLELKIAPLLDNVTRHYLDVITSGVTRMSELIQDLLSYSRVTKTNPEMELVDMDLIVGQVIADLDMAIRQQDASIQKQRLPKALGNSSLLRHVIQNLVGNALKFRAERAPKVEITGERNADHVTFCVRDNGIGLDMQYRDQIFEVFRRLHGREKYAGTGIGLAICKKIIERLGGRIWVESTPGEGSAFLFTLPAAK